MRHSPSGYLGTHLIVLAVYVFLALVLTLPLATEFSTHVPGDGIDAPPLTWNLWWVKHALVDLKANPFDSDSLFYPIKINLAFYTLTVLPGVLSIALQGVVGLVAASNFMLLSSYVLGAWGAFLLIEHILCVAIVPRLKGQSSAVKAGWMTPLRVAAFVGGFIYAFSSSKLFFAALGQSNIASSQWIPYYILFLCKMRQSPQRLKPPIMAGLFLLFQTWAEMTYASFLIIFTVLFSAYHLLSGQRSRSLSRFVMGLFIIAIIFLIGIAPIMANMLPDLVTEGNFLMERTGFAEAFSSDILGLVVPTQLHPWLGGWVGNLNFPHDKGQHLFLGFITLALALYGTVRWLDRGVVRFWVITTSAFLLLSLGPTARFNGIDLSIPLPFQLLQRLPFFNANRYPGRISVMVVMGLAVLASFGILSLWQALAGRSLRWRTLVGAGLASLLIFEHLSVPLPLSDLRIPEVYQLIGQNPAEATVLDIPVAWRNGFRVTGTMDPVIMFSQFYQTTHEKRLLSGNTSRNPEYKFQYFTELPVINSLIALETGHPLPPGTAAADAGVAAQVLRFFNIRYVVVHTAQAGPEMIAYIESALPVERFYKTDDIVAYRVKLPAPDPVDRIDLGEPAAAAHLGEGWGEAYVTDGYVWAQRDGTRLMALLDGGAKTMSFRLWTPGARQVLRVEANGHALPALELAEGWGEYEIDLPVETLRPGLNRFELRFSRLFPAGKVMPEGSPLGSSNINVPANILVKSGGQEIGDFGHIYVNGRNVSPEEIGYNIVLLSPETGAVIDRRSFNTFASAEASQQLADWVTAVPTGTIAAVAVRDEASMHLSEPAVQALRSLGLQGDLRDRFRWSHAAIGAKGLAPGQALEDIQSIRPATVKLGLGVTEPQVAAAFDWIKFSAAQGH